MSDTTPKSTKEKMKGTTEMSGAAKNVAEGSPFTMEASNQVRAGLKLVVPKETLEVSGDAASSQSGGKSPSQPAVAARATLAIPEAKEELVAHIDYKLHQQLKVLSSEERKARGGIWSSFDPEKLNYILSQIRKIQLLLANILYMTIDALKMLYISILQPKGA